MVFARAYALVLSLLLAVGVVGCSSTAARNEARVTLSAEQLDDFAALRVFFAHQSVGASIVGALPKIYAETGTDGLWVSEAQQAPNRPSFLVHEFVGTNGTPMSKLSGFRTALDGGLGSKLDVALVKLCFLDIHAGTDVSGVFAAYEATMSELELDYSDVRFLYTTVPLTVEPGWKSKLKWRLKGQPHPDVLDNVAREQYNALVRARYGSSGRLVDVAEVESTSADGSRDQHEYEGQVYFTLDQDLAADPGHLNELGSLRGAEALIRAATGSS